ncbi:hypothetical protein [Streptomyces sp. NPDC002088]|uniref:hypothetical protein n=1 Tax=Streptomyces sp. NPDC002088 TaxID=3154665 RepID=UPI003324FBA0
MVVTGGTDGIGRVLAAEHPELGDTAVVVGRDAVKGEAFRRRTRQPGAHGRAFFVCAGLEFRESYGGGAALGQHGKLNGLLGVVSAERCGGAGLRYVLIHPGATRTSICGQYDEPTPRYVPELQRTAKSRP